MSYSFFDYNFFRLFGVSILIKSDKIKITSHLIFLQP